MSKSRFEQLFRKNKFECKNCGCTNFYVFDYQNFLHLKYSPFGDV